jgi:PhnB protein
MNKSVLKPGEAMPSITSSIVPWLSVRNGLEALHFYKSAFGATEVYRLDTGDDSVVVRLSVQGAEFWLSSETGGTEINPKQQGILGGQSVRMILTVTDPDSLFLRALEAGAIQVFPVGEDHGWRLGRLEDPFGMHWEIGRPVGDS